MRPIALLFASLLAAAPVAAQQPRVLTADDYARAERFMGYNTTPLVYGGAVRATWLAGDRFWYRNAIPEGVEVVLVDPARKTRERAFDHARLAAALSRVADTTYDAFHLPGRPARAGARRPFSSPSRRAAGASAATWRRLQLRGRAPPRPAARRPTPPSRPTARRPRSSGTSTSG